MKKFLSILLAILMVTCMFAGCNQNNNSDDTNDTSNTTATDSTTQIDNIVDNNGEVPELSDVENKMLASVGELQLNYPVMTFALEMENTDQIDYYFDKLDTSNIKALGLTETAYEFDPSLASSVFSIVFAQVKDVSGAETVRENLLNKIKTDRWSVEMSELNVESAIVDDYVIIVIIAKSETAYTPADILTSLKAQLNATNDVVNEPQDSAQDANTTEDSTTPLNTSESTENATTPAN